MNDAAVIIALIAALLAGAIVGAVSVLTLITAAIHKAASSSVLMPSSAKSSTGHADELQDAADTLEAYSKARDEVAMAHFGPQAALDASPTGKIAPTRSSRVLARAPGCGWCKRLRKAVFG